jgi:hypothetical protein
VVHIDVYLYKYIVYLVYMYVCSIYIHHYTIHV